ncbi:MAG: fused MFS/spermidine synthase [Pirellulales bacterium]
MGDARLTMEREPEQNYDVIVLDAFSGDSVPAHLLTREAFDIYRKHLRKHPDGSIAGHLVLHITNSNLNLYPIAKNAAEHVMRMKYTSIYDEGIKSLHKQRTHYFVISDDQALLDALPFTPRYKERKNAATGESEKYAVDYNHHDIPLWTDHYSNLFAILLEDD